MVIPEGKNLTRFISPVYRAVAVGKRAYRPTAGRLAGVQAKSLYLFVVLLLDVFGDFDAIEANTRGRTVVLKGLASGEPVVLEGLDRLENGRAVNVVQAPPLAASSPLAPEADQPGAPATPAR